jgi:hypothetical protein
MVTIDQLGDLCILHRVIFDAKIVLLLSVILDQRQRGRCSSSKLLMGCRALVHGDLHLGKLYGSYSVKRALHCLWVVSVFWFIYYHISLGLKVYSCLGLFYIFSSQLLWEFQLWTMTSSPHVVVDPTVLRGWQGKYLLPYIASWKISIA